MPGRSRCSIAIFACALSWASAFAGPVRAQTPAPTANPQPSTSLPATDPLRPAAPSPAPLADRHLGVQLRALLGPALLYAFQDVGPGTSGRARGVGAAFEFALGSMVGERLALNFDLVLARSGDAEHGVLTDTTFSAVHLGAGLTYWLMPANVYLAASLGLARSSIEGSPVHFQIELPTNEQTRIGVGAHLALGKQFWLSQRVGLGASLGLLTSAASNPAGGRDTPRFVLGAIAALSATLH